MPTVPWKVWNISTLDFLSIHRFSSGRKEIPQFRRRKDHYSGGGEALVHNINLRDHPKCMKVGISTTVSITMTLVARRTRGTEEQRREKKEPAPTLFFSYTLCFVQLYKCVLKCITLSWPWDDTGLSFSTTKVSTSVSASSQLRTFSPFGGNCIKVIPLANPHSGIKWYSSGTRYAHVGGVVVAWEAGRGQLVSVKREFQRPQDKTLQSRN